MPNRFWNPSADANWADANVWATTFNGDPTGVATPTQNDDCFFTATNSHKCTIGATANCNNLYFDNADNGGKGDYVGTLAGSSFLNVYRNLVMSSGMSVSFSGYLYFKATSGSYNIDTKGISLACVVFEIGVTTQNAAYTLQSNLVLTNSQSAITLSSGSFITNGKTLTIPALNCNNAYTKSLDISNSNIEINYAGFMINALDIDATTTFTSTNSTIKFTDTTNGNITFAGGGKTYNNIYFSRGASTGSITITGANTFNDFKDDGTAAHSLLFTKSTTNNVATWNVNGAGGGGSVRTILDTADGAGTFTLHGTGTSLSCDWLDIRRSTVDASPGWYAGANSLNTASNTNWIFTAPPVASTAIKDKNYISNSISI